MKRVLITGGAGFLGQNLARRLLRLGERVTIFDNFHTGRELDDDIAGKVNTIFGDVTNLRYPDRLDEHDEIYHLACPASPVHYQKDPISTLDTCYLGTKHVLMLAIGWKAKILLASTSEVYGNPMVSPQSEEYLGNTNSFGPRACYDEGKRVAEALAWAHMSDLGGRLKIARIFNTYGPGMSFDDGRMIPEFFRAALAGKDIPVHGDGRQTRSLCYVDDLIRGLHFYMNSSVGNMIVNLGNPDEVSVGHVAEKVIQVCGSSSSIRYIDRPVDDPDRRCPNIDRAAKLFAWEPLIDLENGLLRCLPYFAQEKAH